MIILKYIAEYKVAGIAANAQLKTIYVNAAALSQNIGAPGGSYNGVWSMEPLADNGTVNKKSAK